MLFFLPALSRLSYSSHPSGKRRARVRHARQAKEGAAETASFSSLLSHITSYENASRDRRTRHARQAQEGAAETAIFRCLLGNITLYDTIPLSLL